jgi:hypothetical protein
MKTTKTILVGCLLALMPLACQAQESASRSEPLRIAVRTDKAEYKRGEVVRVEVIVTNRSARPITLAKAIHDGTPAGYAGLAGERAGQPVEWGSGKSSMPFAGVMASSRVYADHFTTLAPGESLTIYWREFDGRYNIPPSKQFKTKQEYFDAGHSPLEPGPYTITARYGFARDAAASRGRWRRPIFQPGAEPLDQLAWTGELVGTATFQVGTG